MPEENIPKNLPIQGKSLLENVKKTSEEPVAPPTSAEAMEGKPEAPTEISTESEPRQNFASQNLSGQAEPRPQQMPQRPPTAESAEAEDIFSGVKETKPSFAKTTKGTPSTASAEEPQSSSASSYAEASDDKEATEDRGALPEEAEPTVVETPRQGFKKILVIISVIVISAGILAGGGYWAYDNFSKPKPLSPLLNLTNTAPAQTTEPTQTTQPIQQVQPTDSDNDGLSDVREKELGTNPIDPDSDGDRLFDREEVEVYKTDPLNRDTDGDGYEDGSEVQAGYDPKGPGKLIRIPADQ